MADDSAIAASRPIYAGDSAADLRVWRHAGGIVLVNARASVIVAARALGKPTLELPTLELPVPRTQRSA